MLQYTNPELFSVYRESIFLKRSFFPIDKRYLCVLLPNFADVVSCMVYKGVTWKTKALKFDLKLSQGSILINFQMYLSPKEVYM
jgi:hypothetical protein